METALYAIAGVKAIKDASPGHLLRYLTDVTIAAAETLNTVRRHLELNGDAADVADLAVRDVRLHTPYRQDSVALARALAPQLMALLRGKRLVKWDNVPAYNYPPLYGDSTNPKRFFRNTQRVIVSDVISNEAARRAVPNIDLQKDTPAAQSAAEVKSLVSVYPWFYYRAIDQREWETAYAYACMCNLFNVAAEGTEPRVQPIARIAVSLGHTGTVTVYVITPTAGSVVASFELGRAVGADGNLQVNAAVASNPLPEWTDLGSLARILQRTKVRLASVALTRMYEPSTGMHVEAAESTAPLGVSADPPRQQAAAPPAAPPPAAVNAGLGFLATAAAEMQSDALGDNAQVKPSAQMPQGPTANASQARDSSPNSSGSAAQSGLGSVLGDDSASNDRMDVDLSKNATRPGRRRIRQGGSGSNPPIVVDVPDEEVYQQPSSGQPGAANAIGSASVPGDAAAVPPAADPGMYMLAIENLLNSTNSNTHLVAQSVAPAATKRPSAKRSAKAASANPAAKPAAEPAETDAAAPAATKKTSTTKKRQRSGTGDDDDEDQADASSTSFAVPFARTRPNYLSSRKWRNGASHDPLEFTPAQLNPMLNYKERTGNSQRKWLFVKAVQNEQGETALVKVGVAFDKYPEFYKLTGTTDNMAIQYTNAFKAAYKNRNDLLPVSYQIGTDAYGPVYAYSLSAANKMLEAVSRKDERFRAPLVHAAALSYHLLMEFDKLRNEPEAKRKGLKAVFDEKWTDAKKKKFQTYLWLNACGDTSMDQVRQTLRDLRTDQDNSAAMVEAIVVVQPLGHTFSGIDQIDVATRYLATCRELATFDPPRLAALHSLDASDPSNLACFPAATTDENVSGPRLYVGTGYQCFPVADLTQSLKDRAPLPDQPTYANQVEFAVGDASINKALALIAMSKAWARTTRTGSKYARSVLDVVTIKTSDNSAVGYGVNNDLADAQLLALFNSLAEVDTKRASPTRGRTKAIVLFDPTRAVDSQLIMRVFGAGSTTPACVTFNLLTGAISKIAAGDMLEVLRARVAQDTRLLVLALEHDGAAGDQQALSERERWLRLARESGYGSYLDASTRATSGRFEVVLTLADLGRARAGKSATTGAVADLSWAAPSMGMDASSGEWVAERAESWRMISTTIDIAQSDPFVQRMRDLVASAPLDDADWLAVLGEALPTEQHPTDSLHAFVTSVLARLRALLDEKQAHARDVADIELDWRAHVTYLAQAHAYYAHGVARLFDDVAPSDSSTSDPVDVLYFEVRAYST